MIYVSTKQNLLSKNEKVCKGQQAFWVQKHFKNINITLKLIIVYYLSKCDLNIFFLNINKICNIDFKNKNVLKRLCF